LLAGMGLQSWMKKLRIVQSRQCRKKEARTRIQRPDKSYSGVDDLLGIPVGIDTTECSPERAVVPKTEMLVVLVGLVGFAIDMLKRV
jgi:hypothetical protein